MLGNWIVESVVEFLGWGVDILYIQANLTRHVLRQSKPSVVIR
jgi:hypothetical protein